MRGSCLVSPGILRLRWATIYGSFPMQARVGTHALLIQEIREAMIIE